MATYYVDPAAGGSNNGTSTTNAWTSVAAAIAGTNGTPPAAGDTVYMKGTNNITSTITFSANGSNASGLIKWIGCNSSWVPDGTYFTIHKGTSAINAIDLAGVDFNHFENIEVTSTSGSGDGIRNVTVAAEYNTYVNVYIHGFTGHGVNSNGFVSRSLWIGCRINDNSSDGFFRPGTNSLFIGCEFSGNGGDGVDEVAGNITFIGCIAKDNGEDGFEIYGTGSQAINCVADDNNQYGFRHNQASQSYLVGCRATNNTSGGFLGHATGVTYFHALHCYSDSTATYVRDISINGTSTNTFSGSDTDDGYEDLAGDDFTLAAGATGEDIQINIDGINSHYISAGLRRQEPAGDGSVIVIED